MNTAEDNFTTGTVTGITSFGAFVKIESGKEGLVHISEIADTYVKDISEFLAIGQQIKIKILGENKKGKLDLSIKRAPGNTLKVPPGTDRAKPRGKKPPSGFEDKISKFLKRSEEKLVDVRRNIQYKQGVKKKRKH